MQTRTKRPTLKLDTTTIRVLSTGMTTQAPGTTYYPTFTTCCRCSDEQLKRDVEAL